ncbi:MAG: hypothetical protein WDN26_11770 [Chitinophagaceae bacterium]
MRKLSLPILLFISFSFAGHTQKIDIIQNRGGGMLYNQKKVASEAAPAKYEKVAHGSPYFSDSWMPGEVQMSEGTIQNDMQIRLDLLEGAVLYMDHGQNMTVTTPLRSVSIKDPVTDKTYTFHNSAFYQFPENMATGWYQLLVDGKARLYKRIEKKLTEETVFNSAATEEQISTSDQYFIVLDSDYTRIKKVKDIPDLLKSKKEEVKAYIKSNGLSGQSETDFSKTIIFYNSLFAK